MRIIHLILLVGVVALALALARENTGLPFLIMFCTGVAEVFVGTTAIMNLFRSIGAIGKAETPVAYVEAVAATLIILVVATAMMLGLFWFCGMLLRTLVVTGGLNGAGG